MYFILGIKFLFYSLISIIKWFVIGLFTVILIFPYYFCLGLYYMFNKNKLRDIGFTKPILPIIMMILSLTTYFISIFIFTRWFVQSERIKKMSESIIESTIILEKHEEQISDEVVIPDNSTISDDSNNSNLPQQSNSNSNPSNNSYVSSSIDFNTWLKRNSDTVAWLTVPGTKVNYPVVQTNDNEYYLNHDINKYSTNVGWIFGDYRSNFDNFEGNTIIYGHNLINKTMFGSLPKILNSNWYKNTNNHYIKMSTADANVVWKVFAIYKIEPVTDYLRTSFYSTQEYMNWLLLMKSRSIYNFNETLNSNDRILTLSTCDDTGNKRVVLQAKLYSFEPK